MIPYGRQNINDDDINAVIDVLQSDFITQGPNVPAFEQAICNITGSSFGCACNSATSALHIACLALDVGKGDLVWTSPNSFVASANCALYCGADVDFVDIEESTGNMSVTELANKLANAERLPKVLIPVHFAGQSCDMEAIYQLSQQYGFKVIEDASHAIGGKYQDKYVGSCQYSDICVFSFHPVKIVTTAEGGLATTNDPELAARLNQYRSHCVTRDPELMNKESEGPWYYQQVDLGFNYRMTELQAALGLSQLNRLEEFVAKRNHLVEVYQTHLSDLNIESLTTTEQVYNAYHLFVIKVPENQRKALFEYFRENNIGVNVHYIPIHSQPYYQKLGFNTGDFPASERYYSQCISLPLFPDLTEAEIAFICSTLKAFLCK